VTIWTDNPNDIDKNKYFSDPNKVTVNSLPEPNSLSLTSTKTPFVLGTGDQEEDGATVDLSNTPGSPPEIELPTNSNGENISGVLFRGEHLDGPPSNFYFDSERSFDDVVKLDDPVQGLERFADWNDISSFKFDELDVGELNLASNSKDVLGIVGESSIDLDSSLENENTSPDDQPRSLFIATQDGPLTVNADPGDDFEYDLDNENNWFFYARGANSNLTFESTFSAIDPGSNSSLTSGGEIRAFAENNIDVQSGAKLEAREVKARAGNTIDLSNSSQLRALVENGASGGLVSVRTQDGPVVMKADSSEDEIKLETCESSCSLSNLSGEVLVESGLASGHNGRIETKNAKLRADTLKMKSYGPSGELIVGKGTTLSASDQMKLYAPGSSGKVLFKNNVTLNGGGDIDIAASTVEIVNGAVVTNPNPVEGGPSTNVYSDNHNYGKSGFGKFEHTPDKDPLDERPAFNDDNLGS